VEPKSFGQKLGIGVRVASRIAKKHLDAHTQPAAPTPGAAPAATAPPVPSPPPAAAPASATPPASFNAAATLRQTTETASRIARERAPRVAKEVVQKSRGFTEGARRFGQAMWGPFAHVSSILWSEITGVFFGLFAFYFARGAFQYRYAYAASARDHSKFVLDLAMALLFGYFAISSFYIARRKEKKRR
jgi:hypothetical protein